MGVYRTNRNTSYRRRPASFIRPLANVATRLALRRYSSRTKTRTATRNNNDNPLTEQRDYKVDYRRRRYSRKQRSGIKRRRTFRKKVERANLRNTQLPKKVVRQSAYNSSSGSGESNFCSALMHSVDGRFAATPNPQADWREFFREGGTQYAQAWDNAANITTSAANPAFPSVGYRSRGIMSMGCTMEVVVRNVSPNQMTVNAYYVVCKRDVPAGYATIEALYDEGFRRAGRVSEDPLTGSNPWDPQIDSTAISATPFQSSLFCRHFTVMRRTKYELSPGHYFTVLTKDTKQRKLYMTSAIGNAFKKGWTEGWFFDFQGVINSDGIAEPQNPVGLLAVQILRRYAFSFLPLKLPQTSFDTID